MHFIYQLYTLASSLTKPQCFMSNLMNHCTLTTGDQMVRGVSNEHFVSAASLTGWSYTRKYFPPWELVNFSKYASVGPVKIISMPETKKLLKQKGKLSIRHQAMSPTVMKRSGRPTQRACGSFWSFRCSLKSKILHLKASQWYHVWQPPEFCNNCSLILSWSPQ